MSAFQPDQVKFSFTLDDKLGAIGIRTLRITRYWTVPRVCLLINLGSSDKSECLVREDSRWTQFLDSSSYANVAGQVHDLRQSCLRMTLSEGKNRTPSLSSRPAAPKYAYGEHLRSRPDWPQFMRYQNQRSRRIPVLTIRPRDHAHIFIPLPSKRRYDMIYGEAWHYLGSLIPNHTSHHERTRI